MKKKLVFLALIMFVLNQAQIFANSDIEKKLSELKRSMRIINQTTLEASKRKQELNKMIGNIHKILLAKDSLVFNQKFMDDRSLPISVFSLLKSSSPSYKIYTYIGPKDLLGSLERTWVFLQCWDNKTMNVFRLAEQGNEVPAGLSVINKKIFVIGYLIHYSPNPVYIQCWQMNNKAFQSQLINYSIKNLNSAVWNVRSEDKKMVVDSVAGNELSIKLLNQKALIVNLDNEDERLIFDLQTNRFVQ